MSNLPPGVTQQQIDRAAGFYPEPEEQADIDADRADHARDSENENLPPRNGEEATSAPSTAFRNAPRLIGGDESQQSDKGDERPVTAEGARTVNRIKRLFYIATTNHQFRRLIRWIRKHKTT